MGRDIGTILLELFRDIRHKQEKTDNVIIGWIDDRQLADSIIDRLQKEGRLVEREKIEGVVKEIREEINSRPQYPNIGKKGCVLRLERILEDSK